MKESITRWHKDARAVQAYSYLRHHSTELRWRRVQFADRRQRKLSLAPFDGVWFPCLKHREFGVSETALKTRKDAEPEQWERALKKRLSERAGMTDQRFQFLLQQFKLHSERLRDLQNQRFKITIWSTPRVPQRSTCLSDGIWARIISPSIDGRTKQNLFPNRRNLFAPAGLDT
jgi:hypothetical protein